MGGGVDRKEGEKEKEEMYFHLGSKRARKSVTSEDSLGLLGH